MTTYIHLMLISPYLSHTNHGSTFLYLYIFLLLCGSLQWSIGICVFIVCNYPYGTMIASVGCNWRKQLALLQKHQLLTVQQGDVAVHGYALIFNWPLTIFLYGTHVRQLRYFNCIDCARSTRLHFIVLAFLLNPSSFFLSIIL